MVKNTKKVTRTDTQPIPVADGWALDRDVFALLNSIITNGPMDQGTKPLIVASLQPKRGPTNQWTNRLNNQTANRPTDGAT